MALVDATLESDLLTAFSAMESGTDPTKDDAWLAKQIAASCESYVNAGQFVISGAQATATAPGGAFSGTCSGTATISVQASLGESVLSAQFTAMQTQTSGGEATFAQAIQDALDAMLGANTISCSLVGSGTISTPSGPTPSPCSGSYTIPAVFVASTISASLLPALSSMLAMSAGGNAYLANQMATVIATAVKSGQISGSGVISSPGPGTAVVSASIS